MKKSLNSIVLLIFALSVVVPLVWVVMTSFKTGPNILASPWSLPTSLEFVNYQNAWREAKIGELFLTSLIVTISTIAILLPIGAMAAYVFAKYIFPGSKFLFGTFLGGMMFPNFLAIVPLFLLMNQLHLQDTKHGLIIVYVAYSLSFTIFIMTSFFQSVPDELAEAAMMDGCGHSATFWKVMLPLARPGIIVAGIFNAIGIWNEYNLAKVLVPAKNQTLPLGLANLTTSQFYQSDWGALFAGLVIVMIPVLAVYWMFREKIHDAMLAGAIK